MPLDLFTAVHEGYMDGLLGKDPQSEYGEYETGWLHGVEDQGKVDPAIFEKPSFKRGDMVSIPKGTELLYDGGTVQRMTKVKLHDVYPMIPAHFGTRREFVKPQPPTILWAGSGGYWKRAHAHLVTKVES